MTLVMAVRLVTERARQSICSKWTPLNDKDGLKDNFEFNALPGTLVPRATNEIAVMASFNPIVQPKWDAKSPMNAVRTPTMMIEVQKQAQPPQ